MNKKVAKIKSWRKWFGGPGPRRQGQRGLYIYQEMTSLQID